jgi:hypothetical protein
MNIGFPTPRFNQALAAGTAGSTLMAILEDLKPEAAYFTEQHGMRGAVLVVDLPDPSKIPALAEPWFLAFDATVEFRVAMTPADLGAADLDGVGRKWNAK